jgi:hypothetical protein
MLDHGQQENLDILIENIMSVPEFQKLGEYSKSILVNAQAKVRAYSSIDSPKMTSSRYL